MKPKTLQRKITEMRQDNMKKRDKLYKERDKLERQKKGTYNK